MNIPSEIMLTEAEYINDTSKFLKSHFFLLENGKKSKAKLPYYLRLLKFYNKLDKL